MSQGENPAAVDAVLLDDDVFVRESWRIFAEDHGRHFLIVETAAELMTLAKTLAKDVPLFVDVELGATRGEAVAATLLHDGFKKVYLATGYTAKDVQPPPGIQGVLGKTPPDWLKSSP